MAASVSTPLTLVVIDPPEGEEVWLLVALPVAVAMAPAGYRLDLTETPEHTLVVKPGSRFSVAANTFELYCRFQCEEAVNERERQRSFAELILQHITSSKSPRIEPPEGPIFGYELDLANKRLIAVGS